MAEAMEERADLEARVAALEKRLGPETCGEVMRKGSRGRGRRAGASGF